MSEFKIGLYFKYEDYAESKCVIKISEYCFDGNNWINGHERVAPLGKIFALKCLCGSNDWTDNGRSVNEYECNGCGQFISVLESKS